MFDSRPGETGLDSCSQQHNVLIHKDTRIVRDHSCNIKIIERYSKKYVLLIV